jgi:hypothetical protein
MVGAFNEHINYKMFPLSDNIFATAFDNGLLKFWNVDNGEEVYQM